MEALASYDAELQSEKNDNMEWETTAGGDWQEGETDGLRAYVCKSCGGEIVGDANLAATACPFCGNPVVMMGQFSGALKPDLVIPFKLDKKAAKAGLMKHLTGKRLLPKIFKDQNHIDEIKGIYVPFLAFRYRCGWRRFAIAPPACVPGVTATTIIRKPAIIWRIVVAASALSMSRWMARQKWQMTSWNLLNHTIFPRRWTFRQRILQGIWRIKYDVTAETSIDRANKRVKRSTEDTFAGTVQGYTTVTTEYSSVQFRGGKARYALYPVWLLNTTWNGNQYTFAMNGQTGKFVGDLPVDKAAAKRWTFLLAAIFTAACYGVAWALHLMGLI